MPEESLAEDNGEDAEIGKLAGYDAIAEHERMLEEKDAEDKIAENEKSLEKKEKNFKVKMEQEDKVEKLKVTIDSVKKQADEDEEHEKARGDVKEILKIGAKTEAEGKKDEIELKTEKDLRKKVAEGDEEAVEQAKKMKEQEQDQKDALNAMPAKKYTQEDLDKYVNIASKSAAVHALKTYKSKREAAEMDAEKLEDDMKATKNPDSIEP